MSEVCGGLFSENKRRTRWYLIPGYGNLPMITIAGSMMESSVYKFIEDRLLKNNKGSYRVLRHMGAVYRSEGPVAWKSNLFDVAKGEQLDCYVSIMGGSGVRCSVRKKVEVAEVFWVATLGERSVTGDDVGYISVRVCESGESLELRVTQYGLSKDNIKILELPQ